ncbi:polysaccharide deacetylase [Rhizobium rhizosphaerae]|uniref:Polysaccharide deacetylase n=1 Tax=Xaviernesmea rhizosphaerae TaxID=1672749 RepID=A0ABX3P816_9HYPH|nr:polysaccharide deacetylase family protein [Xaviernesmea rhizosphaerae]OQP84241.1 polysaccharide deacetylase [Xaviernesmea rhizosphaerae]
MPLPSVADPLLRELDRWHARGAVAPLWLRDDDAVSATPALERLVEQTERFSVPVTLAVIPADEEPSLRNLVASEPHVSVAVHGWRHADHAAPGVKKQELGPERPAETVLAELSSGLGRLRAHYGAHLLPVLVPPWNRIDAALLPALPGLGFQALSVYGREKPGPIPAINTHVDLIDWHGTRGGRPPERLFAEIAARLSEIAGTGATMGLLTHHLVHDAAAWSFLETLFKVTAAHPACRWEPLSAHLQR